MKLSLALLIPTVFTTLLATTTGVVSADEGRAMRGGSNNNADHQPVAASILTTNENDFANNATDPSVEETRKLWGYYHCYDDPNWMLNINTDIRCTSLTTMPIKERQQICYRRGVDNRLAVGACACSCLGMHTGCFDRPLETCVEIEPELSCGNGNRGNGICDQEGDFYYCTASGYCKLNPGPGKRKQKRKRERENLDKGI